MLDATITLEEREREREEKEKKKEEEEWLFTTNPSDEAPRLPE